MRSIGFLLIGGFSFRSRMMSPPNAQTLSTCFWMVFGDRSAPTRCSRNGRKQATSFSPGPRSFSHAIQERGHFSRPRQYRSSSEYTAGGARFRVEVFAVAAAGFCAMQLITILNRCHRFPGFVYYRDRISPGQKMIEISVRPRKGSAAICSRCHLPAPGYDQLAERRFVFIPLWGFFVFLLYPMRRA